MIAIGFVRTIQALHGKTGMVVAVVALECHVNAQRRSRMNERLLVETIKVQTEQIEKQKLRIEKLRKALKDIIETVNKPVSREPLVIANKAIRDDV